MIQPIKIGKISRRKAYKILRRFAREFGYDYRKMKNTYDDLDDAMRKSYLEKMNIFLSDLETKKLLARDTNLLPNQDPVLGNNLI